MILDRPFKAGAPGPNIPARRVATVDPTFHSIVALRRARIMARGAGLKRPASGDWTFVKRHEAASSLLSPAGGGRQ